MTYNMLNAPHQRVEGLRDVVEYYQPDVLVCQEITDIPGLLHLSAMLGMPSVIAMANGPEVLEADRDGDLSKASCEHIALLSRYPIIGFCRHPGDPRVMFRSVLEARIEVPGLGVIRGFGVHLRSFPGPAGAQYKLREAEVLSALLRGAADSGYRFVLGDFNAWVRGQGEIRPEFDRYPRDHIEAIVGGVTDVVRQAGVEDVWNIRGTPAEAVPGTVPRLGRCSPVDHIMVSPDLGQYLSQVTVPEPSSLLDVSDHLPVLADFAWD